MATYGRIWVVPRVFNLVPETSVLGVGFFWFFRGARNTLWNHLNSVY
jgi:hypothetical protein